MTGHGVNLPIPIQETGESFSLKTGSKRMYFPATCTRSDECPNHVTVKSLSAGVAEKLGFMTGRAVFGRTSFADAVFSSSPASFTITATSSSLWKAFPSKFGARRA